jgi:hypothetical protein
VGDGYRGIASPIKLSRTPANYRLAPLTEGDRFACAAAAPSAAPSGQ